VVRVSLWPSSCFVARLVYFISLLHFGQLYFLISFSPPPSSVAAIRRLLFIPATHP
jgi:hypothetical protein